MHRKSIPACILPVLVALLTGCATETTDPQFGTVSEAPFSLSRIQSQSQNGLNVQIAVPTDPEVSNLFGVPLFDDGIQPIWLRIENTSDNHYWILPIAIDPDYYTVDEAAYAATRDLSDEDRVAVTEALRQNALPFFLHGGSVHEGYVYASYVRGGRFIDLRFSAPGHGVRMRFAVMLPTQSFDYEHSGVRQLYSRVAAFPDLNLDETRQRLRELPCCTTNEDGDGAGDPLNLVLVGSGAKVISALTASSWTFTEEISVDSVRRMIGAAIAEKSMLTAPVSALYLFGRPQDLALQRGRSTIHQRNHMRLWLAPFRCNGQPVWVGQVSRDIGVKVTSKSATLTTHVIDPNVDESRQYVLQALLYGEAVRWFALVQGVGAAPRSQPRVNLTDDPYFTDGNRMVIRVARRPVQPWQAVNLEWNESSDPILEDKGQDATVHQERL